MKTPYQYLCFCAVTLIFFIPVSAATSLNASEQTGHEIISEVDRLLWGRTSQGRYTMTIITPHWQRTLELQIWMQRPDQTFIRILAPAKEAGITSLRIKSDMWNYLPKVERTIKIPPSMMLQPWMGSDFTNDDLVKESSMIDDYTHEVVAVEGIDDEQVFRVRSIPKPEAAVVWGRLIYRVRQSDLMPLKLDYYDERGRLIKVLSFSDVRKIGGRVMPTRWEMQPADKPGNTTVISLKEFAFDLPIPESVFTLRNLRSRR